MSIINFAVSQPLEQKINQVIKNYGFASKAEFFRFLAINYIDQKDQAQINEDQEFDQVIDDLTNTIRKTYGGKKLPSVEEQFADI